MAMKPPRKYSRAVRRTLHWLVEDAWVERPLDASGFRPWMPLLGLGFVLAMLAVLPRLAVGQYVLLDLSETSWFSGETRLLVGSGRFFWLVSYAVLFLLIALVVHAHPPRRAALLLGFVLVLQVADLREQFAFVHQQATKHLDAPAVSSPERSASAQAGRSGSHSASRFVHRDQQG